MVTGKVSGYQPRPVDYAREPEPREVERKQSEPNRPAPEDRRAEKAAESRQVERKQAEANQPTPDERRAESVANRQKQGFQKLGSQIDVYA